MSSSTSPEDRRRLETLFHRAADLPREDHAAFVERECASNPALRDELERLLAGLSAEDVLDQLQAGAPVPSGTRVGAYKLLERVGQGGMGEVYAADQIHPVRRKVALKLIKPGMDSTQVVARFEAERQALARMDHPYVAQVFDGGTSDDGRPYFVMEYVAGEPITEYCDRRKLATRARVELFLGVCEGVQHAHQKGLIHRDLKPSNLMVTQREGRGCPKIIDFGVARATTGSLAERTLHTMLGQIVGTLDYMSPEQADPTAMDIDTRSDIYSLGVVLYLLVSGLLPFDHQSAVELPLSEIQRTIREVDPPTPSTRLRRDSGTATSRAALHGTDERSLIHQLAGDLDWICMKALEKDPDRRYSSVSELAQDIRRHLAHQPVLAGRPGALYRARKFVRRHRVGVTAGVLVASAVFAGTAGIITARLEARASERFARAAIDSERALAFEVLADDLWPPHPDRIHDLEYWLGRAREVADRRPQYRAFLANLRGRTSSPDSTEPATWHFDTREDESRHAALVGAIEAAERLEAGLLAEDSITAEHGWSVAKRLVFARELEAGFAEGGKYAEAWADALPELHSARADLNGDGVREAAYPDLDLKQQMGLLPLGPDPASGLWEFAHLLTGESAKRDANGKLVLTEATGLVLTLIPGGTFRMGAQEDERTQAEHPQHEVSLTPYFLSKYEMTQGPWKRLTGRNPSAYGNGPDRYWRADWVEAGDLGSLLHPVEQVSWLDCDQWLRRAGLSLPSEAQWERGARAGTQTRFSSGPDPESLEGAANLRDVHFANDDFEVWTNWQENFDDGSTVHWEVGSHRANSFGLHDVHGNVWEWCLDGYELYGERVIGGSAVVDPVAAGSSDNRRVYRGGSFRHMAGAAGSAARSFDPPSFSGSARGVRPARAIAN